MCPAPMGKSPPPGEQALPSPLSVLPLVPLRDASNWIPELHRQPPGRS